MRTWMALGFVALVACETRNKPTTDTVFCRKKQRPGWLYYGCYDMESRCKAGWDEPCVSVQPVAWTCYEVRSGRPREACLPTAAMCSEVAAVTIHDRSIAGRQTDCAPAPSPTCFHEDEGLLWCRSTPESCKAARDDLVVNTRYRPAECEAWPVTAPR